MWDEGKEERKFLISNVKFLNLISKFCLSTMLQLTCKESILAFLCVFASLQETLSLHRKSPESILAFLCVFASLHGNLISNLVFTCLQRAHSLNVTLPGIAMAIRILSYT